MADKVITDFIRALRSADIRVSIGESIDAARAVRLIGYADRAKLADTLRCVLAKSPEEKATHDRLFDLYFSRALDTASKSVSNAAPGDTETDTTSDDMLSLIESGDEAKITIALAKAGQEAEIQDIEFSTQVSFFAQKMMKSMGLERLDTKMMDAFRRLTDEGEGEAEKLIEARREMFMRARNYAQQAFETYGAGATETFRQEFLSEKAITQLDRRDLERMRTLVEKLARRLAVKHSRRRSKKNRGQLDLRKTLRKNAGFDGVPFELLWKNNKRDRPKIVAVCDVSGSVASVVRFFLMLIYSLNDVVPDIESFAFSGRLESVGDILEQQDFSAAMDEIIFRIGMSSTDYGQSFSDLKMDHWNVIDRRTTLIVLGDGRSNYGDPRVDIFSEAASRAKQTIWLCPEAESQWGSGDSEIPRYRPYANRMVHVRTIKDLERVLDEVLASYN